MLGTGGCREGQMTTISSDGTMSGAKKEGILDREHTIAKAGFNRWLVPPAALCIHLCIGMAYGFSVFWLPLSRAVGLTAPKACPDMSLLQELFTTTCDWRVASMGWMFTLFFVLLGVSAAIWGGWLERVGPRKAGVVAALCWGGGLLIGAFGVYVHQLWIMWLGAGVIGGVGLGLGYISPVSTLIKWFPDHRGMATGFAIAGFGGGAMIGAPLANLLITYFKTPTSDGVWEIQCDDLGEQRSSQRRAQDPAILADLGGALPERVGRHRRDRHGLADVAGDIRRQTDWIARRRLQRAERRAEGNHRRDCGWLRRNAVAVQHRRPGVLGVAVGLYRPQEYLFLLLPARHLALRAGADLRRHGLQTAVCRRVLYHPVDVWRWLRHRAGLSCRHVRNAVRGRHSRAAADGVVDGGHHRSGGRQLYPRVPARGRRSARPAL